MISSDPERLLTASNYLYILAGLVGLISTLAIVHFGSKVSSIKEAQLKAQQAAANERIAAANQESNIAKAAAAQANENASQANQKAEEARAKAEQILHDNLILQKQVEEERAARIAIEKQIAPRNFSREQRELLIGKLKPLGGQHVDLFIYPNDLEIQALANSIAFTFKQWDGWEVRPFEAPNGTTRGILVEYDPKDSQAAARGEVIVKALSESGLYVSGPFGVLPIPPGQMRQGISYAINPDATLRITVGRK
jgi:multidrug efflux pump subunit AcrA (membrane-fusion protein)